MSDQTSIEWTDATWNPVRGCTSVSPGCKNCYAETFAERWRGVPGHPYEQGFDLRLVPQKLGEPLRWKKPRRVFVNSMSDLFHEGVPDEYIDRVFAVMALAPQHTFQVLTKRAERMASYLGAFCRPGHVWRAAMDFGHSGAQGTEPESWPLRNVWCGVSVENQKYADERRECLKATPAAVRFVSYEPALGPVAWAGWEFLDWLISGGESGHGARPAHPDWFRAARDFCRANEVAYFFKQHGAWLELGHGEPDRTLVDSSPEYRERAALADGFLAADGDFHGSIDAIRPHVPYRGMRRVGKKVAGRLLDGQEWNEFPEVPR